MRRHVSSSSDLAPAWLSPLIANVCSVLRRSTGTLRCVCVAPADLISTLFSASTRPSPASACTIVVCGRASLLRTSTTISLPVNKGLPRASGGCSCEGVKICNVPICASPSAKGFALVAFKPSANQAICCGADDRDFICARVFIRSVGKANGNMARKCFAASEAFSACGICGSAVPVRYTSWSPASAIRPSAASCLFRQSLALAQPSSITSSSVPFVPLRFCGRCWNGWETARMISAASARRNNSSHQGILSGVVSFSRNRNKMRKGGKATSCGRGGIVRNSHQMTGSASRAHRARGVANVRALKKLLMQGPSADEGQVRPVPAVCRCGAG